MSTRLEGFRPPDDDFKRKLAAYHACKAAGVEIPEELLRFFDYVDSPDPTGVVVELYADYGAAPRPGVTRWERSSGGAVGVEIDLEALRAYDPTIKVLRFYNSW